MVSIVIVVVTMATSGPYIHRPYNDEDDDTDKMMLTRHFDEPNCATG